MGLVRINADQLFVFVDCIALLDMLCSFTDLITCSGDIFSRPILSDAGPLVIQEGRHVIMSSLEDTAGAVFGPVVSNDTYMSTIDNFQIVTGCNGAG